MRGYAKTKSDFNFLNDLDVKFYRTTMHEVDHGGIDECVFRLMESPTKSHAAKMYRDAIVNWFTTFDRNGKKVIPVEHHKRIEGIRERHNV